MKMNSVTSASSIQYKLFLVLSLCFLVLPVSAEPDPVVLEGMPAAIQQDGVLKGNVSVAKDLPQEFYGTWSVVSELVDTNNPELFRRKSSDIWTFERRNDVIILTNPVSGASASITVKEVKNKTAAFSRTKNEKDLKELEKAEITVEGDNFYGTDTIIMKHFRNGRRIKTDIVKYKVTGYKISGPTLKDIFAK